MYMTSLHKAVWHFTFLLKSPRFFAAASSFPLSTTHSISCATFIVPSLPMQIPHRSNNKQEQRKTPFFAKKSPENPVLQYGQWLGQHLLCRRLWTIKPYRRRLMFWLHNKKKNPKSPNIWIYLWSDGPMYDGPCGLFLSYILKIKCSDWPIFPSSGTATMKPQIITFSF